MLIFDAHLDLAWNALDWNRDLLLPVPEIRNAEKSMVGKARERNTVSFPDMRRGRVGLGIYTLLPRLLRDIMPPLQRYNNMISAYACARGQMAYYEQLVERGYLFWIKNRKELDRAASQWSTTDTDTAKAPLAFILSMEGADSVLSPGQIEEWWNRGLRILGPAHYGVSPYAHGTGTEGGLFSEGPALLRAMDRVGMILDVTHLSDQCFDEALEIYKGPVLASHHNCRALVPNQRQLTDDQIKRLIQRGAVIGAAFDNWMLDPNWVRGESDPKHVTMKHVCDHIDRVCQLAGNTRHAAIGSDLDGGFGTEQSPSDVDTIADLQQIPVLLKQRGYSDEDVKGIAHGNWIRFFREAWSRNVG
jgi:membrane dipeptidase